MILSALTDYYNLLLNKGTADIAPYGYSYEGISYVLVLSGEGELIAVQDIRDTSGKKPRAKPVCVPQPEKRTSGVKSNFLWDKTSYVLGVSAKDGGRTATEHEAFKSFHQNLLSESDDPGLIALLRFLSQWRLEQFIDSGKFDQEMLDANMAFRLETEQGFIHDRPAARDVRAKMVESDGSSQAPCLVSGHVQAVARLHPAVKGVSGAQSSGASIVSFNLGSSTSYGKIQGENAPISEQSAFAYTTALTYLLRRDEHNRQRLQIGDATVVFWAVADSSEQAVQAESLFAYLVSPPAADDASETDKLRSVLQAVAKGQALKAVDPRLEPNTQMFVLGLAPNAARISIRFWERGSLQSFAERIAEHYHDLILEPTPWKSEPSVWRLLLETVPHREGSKPKADDVQPLLGGELMRSVLTGARYPQNLLTNLIMRMRADGDISPLRVALCKAVLARDKRKGIKGNQQEVPVSLDPTNDDPGYLLGRLFSVLENIQKSALGKNINATIRDRYYGSASATPASVFPVLIRNTQNHLSRLRKAKPGLAVNLERELSEIVERMGASFPRSLRIEAQGHFAIGYYHQTQSRFKKAEISEEGEDA